jgi:hypothetical protein
MMTIIARWASLLVLISSAAAYGAIFNIPSGDVTASIAEV